MRFEIWGLWRDVICYSFVSFRHSGTIMVCFFVNNIYQKEQACGLSVVLNVVQTEINTLWCTYIWTGLKTVVTGEYEISSDVGLSVLYNEFARLGSRSASGLTWWKPCLNFSLLRKTLSVFQNAHVLKLCFIWRIKYYPASFLEGS